MRGPPDLTPLGPADAADMQALHAPLFDSPWSAEAIAEQLAAPAGCALGVCDPDLQGFVLLRVMADEAEILIIAVSPGAQRRGVGRALLAGAHETAAARGAATLWLEVALDNAPACALYRAAGFVETGRRPGYYARSSGERVDALLLRRDLSGGA